MADLPARVFNLPVPRSRRKSPFGGNVPVNQGSIRATFGPTPTARFGTARRDAYGNLIPGEFDQYGKPIPQGAPGLTPQGKWDEMFPPAKAPQEPAQGTGAQDAIMMKDAKEKSGRDMKTAAQTAQREDNAAVTQEAGNLRSAQRMTPNVGTTVVQAPTVPGGGTAPTQATVIAPHPATRTNAFGGTETLMDSASGPRWVGSVSNPPPATNFRPGDSGTKSLADHVTVTPRPAPMPTVLADGTKTNVPTVQQNLDYYKPGGAFGPSADGSPIDGAIAAGAGTGQKIATPYGSVSSTAAPVVQGLQASNFRPPTIPSGAPAALPSEAPMKAPPATGGLSAAVNGARDAISTAAGSAMPAMSRSFSDMMSTARNAGNALSAGAGAAAGAIGDTASDLWKKGRTAFGNIVQPLKDAVATMQQVGDDQPRRQDLVQSAGYSGYGE